MIFNYLLVFTPCEGDEDCAHLEGGSCIDRLCVCNGTRFCTDKILTIVTKIGEACKVNEECNIDNSECVNKKCTCLPGYVASHSGKTCLMGESFNNYKLSIFSFFINPCITMRIWGFLYFEKYL